MCVLPMPQSRKDGGAKPREGTLRHSSTATSYAYWKDNTMYHLVKQEKIFRNVGRSRKINIQEFLYNNGKTRGA